MNGDHSGRTAAIYRDGTYLKHNQTWHVEDSAWKADHIAAMLMRNGIDPARICEVGCGAGEVLRQVAARFRNARCVGYELSPQAFALCRERVSARVSYRHADVLQEDVFFDCLLCVDVFEHVEDYMGFLRALKAKAHHKLFHVPLDLSALAVLRSAMLRERESVGHLHYFSRDTALATLRDCGYEILDSAYTPHFLDWPASTPLARGKRALRRLLYGAWPDFAVRFWGGCSLMVLAQ